MNESAFQSAMEALIETMINEVYTPFILMGMVKSGAKAAAHQVVGGRKPTPGFERLYKAKRLDLSVENLILDPRWAPGFEGLLEAARARLKDYGFTPTH